MPPKIFNNNFADHSKESNFIYSNEQEKQINSLTINESKITPKMISNNVPIKDSDSGHGVTSSSSASDSLEDLSIFKQKQDKFDNNRKNFNNQGNHHYDGANEEEEEQIQDNFVDAIDSFEAGEEQINHNDNLQEEKQDSSASASVSDEDDKNYCSNKSKEQEDDNGEEIRKQLSEVTVILKMALNNEFAKALELCAGRTNELYFSLAHSTLCFLRCALTLEQSDLQAALKSINECYEISLKKKRKTSTAASMMFRLLLYKPDYNNYTDEEIHSELINAESLLLTALISFLADQSILCFVKGAFRIRSCYQHYKECIFILENRTNWSSNEAKKHFESGVRMGYGIFNLLMSYLPRRILRLLEYVGFSGNRQLGIDELDKSINLNDNLRSVFSNLVILTYHTYIENLFGLGYYDLNKVSELNNKLKIDYPQSAFYYLFLGRFNQMNGNLLEAINSYKLCIKSQNDWKQFHSICHWEMIWCYCVELNWDKAIYYSNLLSKQSKWSPAGYTYLYGTFLYAKLQQDLRNKLIDKNSFIFKEKLNIIIEIMKLVPKLRIRYAGKTIPAEKFAITRAKKFLDQQNRLVLPALEFLYIWNMFAVFKNNSNQLNNLLMLINSEMKYLKEDYLKDNLQILENDLNDDNEKEKEAEGMGKEIFNDDIALCLLLRAMCLKHLNRDEEAEEDFKTILNNEEKINVDTFLVPHSIMELAVLKLSHKQYDLSRMYLKMARDDYTGYLLESIVHFRLHSTSRAIRIEQQQEELEFSKSSGSSDTENKTNN